MRVTAETIPALMDELHRTVEFYKDIKGDFAKYIKDTKIPLESRWVMFTRAPEFMKDHDSFIGSILDFDISWYDDFNLDRGQEMTAVSFIAQVEEWDGDDESNVKVQLKNRLDEVKEWILNDNLGSWCNDW